jgi:anaerobic ribonucleoside-triphosphate reductase
MNYMKYMLVEFRITLALNVLILACMQECDPAWDFSCDRSHVFCPRCSNLAEIHGKGGATPF